MVSLLFIYILSIEFGERSIIGVVFDGVEGLRLENRLGPGLYLVDKFVVQVGDISANSMVIFVAEKLSLVWGIKQVSQIIVLVTGEMSDTV